MPYKTHLEWREEPDCCCLIGIYLGKMVWGKTWLEVFAPAAVTGVPPVSLPCQQTAEDANSNHV